MTGRHSALRVVVTVKAAELAALMPAIPPTSLLSQATRTAAESVKSFSFDGSNCSAKALALEMSRRFQSELVLAKVFSFGVATPLAQASETSSF